MAQFRPKQLAHLDPKSVAQIRPFYPLLKSFGNKSFLPNAPAFVIRLLFGEMAVMLLEGSKVSNEKLKNTGFYFEFDTLEKSLCL